MLLAGCAAPPPEPVRRVETLEVAHVHAGRSYALAFLPDLDGLTFVTGDGERLFLPGPPVARLALWGGGIGRADRDLALAVVAGFCAGRAEYACVAFRTDNGGPIFVEGRWLLQFER